MTSRGVVHSAARQDARCHSWLCRARMSVTEFSVPVSKLDRLARYYQMEPETGTLNLLGGAIRCAT